MNSKWVNILSGVGITTLSAIAVVLAMAGCDKGSEVDVVEASVESSFKLDEKFEVGTKDAFEIADKDTGVHYLVVYESGRMEGGIAITPLYNADGSLKVEGENGNE